MKNGERSTSPEKKTSSDPKQTNKDSNKSKPTSAKKRNLRYQEESKSLVIKNVISMASYPTNHVQSAEEVQEGTIQEVVSTASTFQNDNMEISEQQDDTEQNITTDNIKETKSGQRKRKGDESLAKRSKLDMTEDVIVQADYVTDEINQQRLSIGITMSVKPGENNVKSDDPIVKSVKRKHSEGNKNLAKRKSEKSNWLDTKLEGLLKSIDESETDSEYVSATEETEKVNENDAKTKSYISNQSEQDSNNLNDSKEAELINLNHKSLETQEEERLETVQITKQPIIFKTSFTETNHNLNQLENLTSSSIQTDEIQSSKHNGTHSQEGSTTSQNETFPVYLSDTEQDKQIKESQLHEKSGELDKTDDQNVISKQHSFTVDSNDQTDKELIEQSEQNVSTELSKSSKDNGESNEQTDHFSDEQKKPSKDEESIEKTDQLTTNESVRDDDNESDEINEDDFNDIVDHVLAA